jgi:chemotaxis protein methyltransferase CheR
MPMLQSDFDQIRKLVLERSGIVLDSGKQAMVEQKLGPVAKDKGYPDATAFAKEVIKNPLGGLSTMLIEEIATPETGFFRDNRAFKALKEAVLPQLLESRGNERTLNIWSGGCSTGQEPYSILMMLQDNFPQLKGWTIRFIATDISQKLLSRAREGVYSQLEMNRGLPAPMLLKYFQKQGLQWQVKPAIRSLIEFRELNLVKPWPPLPKMDIIFLRNVLVYFNPETKRGILDRIGQTLRPDGFMFMGMAEIPMTADNKFEKLDYERSGCFRLRG